MRIIAFIQDTHSIKDIMKAQGIADFRAPPPIPKFIETVEAAPLVQGNSGPAHFSVWFWLVVRMSQ